MAREIFGPGMFREESKIVEQLDKKRKRETKPKTADWWQEEKQEQESFGRLREEATSKYEEALGVPPPEDWTAEQIAEAVDKKIQKEREPRGLPKPWEIKRGHRKGLKRVKSREQKEAA